MVDVVRRSESKLGIPTTKFNISDIDESGDPAYYGYLDTEGNWYIMEFNVASGTCRFATGTTGYTTSWTGRAALEYGYFDAVF